MRASPSHFSLLIVFLTTLGSVVEAQSFDPSAGMHWRHIGPYRAGRGRAVAGVPSQPNVFYISFDNGGVWRSTDFGSNWVPLFDDQSTGSIGAIAVAPSDPNIIYVGSGAGIIRPDLATGDGLYKSTDAGKTWTHLGLHESQMIAYIDVDPTNPNRLFVAVLGHPYGPNQERGIFRSTDGGQAFEKVHMSISNQVRGHRTLYPSLEFVSASRSPQYLLCPSSRDAKLPHGIGILCLVPGCQISDKVPVTQCHRGPKRHLHPLPYWACEWPGLIGDAIA